MQEILKKLNDLVGICETRVSKLDKERAEVASQREANEKTSKILSTRLSDIEKREKALKDSDDVLVTLHQAKDLVREANEEKGKLGDLRGKLEEDIKKHEKTVKDFEAWKEDQQAKMAKQVKEIEAKAKNYKKEVMDAVVKEAEKRG